MSDDVDHILDQLLAAFRSGAPEPEALSGTVDLDTAYTIQVRLLHRLRNAGARHTGWKIGQTNAAMRRERGETKPAPGFLLSDVAIDDGAAATLAARENWFLEPELAFVLAAPLNGPGVTEQDVASAVASWHPAFELVKQVPGWTDRVLQRAVNGTNAGYVLGPAQISPIDAAALDALNVQMTCDGTGLVDVRAGDVNDNPLTSTAWLANYLADLGETLAPGHIVLTGSYAGLLPMAPGQAWRATLDGHAVSLTTR